MTSSLPEPNFINRDVATITQEWIALYELKTGKTLQPAQIERILIDVGVYRESLLRIGIQEAAKQNLVNFATYPMLDYLGELVDVYRIKAKSATTVLKFILEEVQDFNVIIPVGTEVESKDGNVSFKTVSSSYIQAGMLFVEVNAIAVSAGTIGNGYLQGEIKNLISPVSYVDIVENTIESTGGAEDEDDDSFRERIKVAPEKFSNAGSKGAYKYWAKTAHQDIIDVAILSPSPGVVKIYPLSKNGNPSTEIISCVQNILSDDKVRPLTDNVIVETPVRIDFQIAANLTLYNYADSQSIDSEVKTSLGKYISGLKSKLGSAIVPSQIIAILNSIYGVFKVDLILPIFTDVLEYQWANCTGFQINIAGYTNG